MNIWVLSGNYDGAQFASSHLTEKGAVLAAIADVLQLLGVEDKEDAQRVMSNDISGKGLMEGDEPIEWDSEKLRSKPRNELWGIFHEWSEYTWDNQMGYSIEVIKTKLAA